MSDGRGPGALPSRLAWALPALFLCMLLPGRAGATASYGGTGAAGVIMALVLFVLPLAYTVPRGRVLWNRHGPVLLVTQAVLTYLPFVLFGQRWVVGLSGLLAGLLLLILPARLGWPLFGAVLAAEAVLRIGVLGLYPGSDISYVAWVFSVPLDIALPLFGLVRLADLVADLRAARTELAGLAVARERAQAGGRLRAAVGDRLDAVTARARSALAALAEAPDTARADLRAAAAGARQAVEQVRRVVAEDWHDAAPPPTRRSGGTLAPRLALLVLVLFMSVYAAQHVLNLAVSTADATAQLVVAAVIVAIVALQLYHSTAGRRRFWGLTLAAQASLPFVVFLTMDDARAAVIGMAAFPAGSALLLLTGWAAWVAFAAIAVGMGVLWPLTYARVVDATAVAEGAYLAGLAASTGLAVYGLSRLTGLAEELEATRRDLAWAAVERERLRVARDAHDLLGQGLSVIALKCDLAGRLIGRDDARVRVELAAVIQQDDRIRADMRAVTSGMPSLSLRAELAAAREVLAWAGIEVRVRGEPPEGSEEVDRILATVLREAVTNMLRHADAAHCEIQLTGGAGTAGLRVANDGAGGEPPSGEGRGLANLTARATALGGQLTAGGDGGRFEVSVRVPLEAPGSGRPDGEPALEVS